MIYLKTNESLSLRFGEIHTTTVPDWHVFYSEPATKQNRDEITQVDSFESARGSKATAITAAETILTGPTVALSDANNGSGSNSRRYKCRVVICNRDTVAHTAFLSTLVGSTHTYILSGVSLPAGGTLTVADDGSVSVTETPITSIIAGSALTGGGSSGAVTLDVAVDNSSIEINADALRVKAAGVTDAMLANMGARSLKGRSANSSGVPADISFASAAGKGARDRGSVLGAFYDWQYSTTNGTVVADDNLKLFNLDATGNITLNITAAATLGAGHVFGVRKSDSTSGTLTIDANSTETIDGATTLVLYKQYDYAIIMCTGSAFVVLSKVLTPPKFSAYQSSAQTALARITDHKITFTTEEFDSHGWYDTSTSRFTPLLAGKYWVMVSIGSTAGGTDGQYWLARIYKNGALAKSGNAFPAGAASNQRGMACALIDFNGSSDYVEGHLYHVYSGNGDVEAAADSTFFQAFYMGA